MRAVESAAVAAKTSEAEMREILDGFARVAMLACLPVRLVDLFFVANRKVWAVQHLPPGEVVHAVTRTAVLKVSAEAFSLLGDATWHSHQSKLRVVADAPLSPNSRGCSS
jgi:hypothetical protein